MARKAKSASAEGINLDSLMDALTNVVAVLILVLVLVQADVTRKVVKFIEDLQPATPEQIERSRSELEESERRKESLIAMLHRAPPSAEQLEEVRNGVNQLNMQLASADKQLAAIRESKNAESALRKEVEAQQKAGEAIRAEVKMLEGKLAAATVPKVTPPVEVAIPNSRPIPEKAVIYRALCHNNRVHIIDVEEALKLFTKEFEKNKRNWLRERVKRKGKPDLDIYDQTKVADHFTKLGLKNAQGQKIGVVTHPEHSHLLIDIAPDLKEGGTPVDKLETKGSPFYNAAVRLMGDMRSVLIYHVHPDSFEAYIKARELSDRARIAAGWEVGSSGRWRSIIPDISVNRLREPDGKANPGPKKPPGTKTKLD